MKTSKANKYIEELEDLLTMLDEYGQCTDVESGCVYVDPRGVHPGCAVGRRLTPNEKELWGKHNSDSYSEMLDEHDAAVPEFFRGWPRILVDKLQSVHDTFSPCFDSASHTMYINEYIEKVGQLKRHQDV